MLRPYHWGNCPLVNNHVIGPPQFQCDYQTCWSMGHCAPPNFVEFVELLLDTPLVYPPFAEIPLCPPLWFWETTVYDSNGIISASELALALVSAFCI